MTATLWGAKMASRGWPSDRSTSCALSCVGPGLTGFRAVLAVLITYKVYAFGEHSSVTREQSEVSLGSRISVIHRTAANCELARSILCLGDNACMFYNPPHRENLKAHPPGVVVRSEQHLKESLDYEEAAHVVIRGCPHVLAIGGIVRARCPQEGRHQEGRKGREEGCQEES